VSFADPPPLEHLFFSRSLGSGLPSPIPFPALLPFRTAICSFLRFLQREDCKRHAGRCDGGINSALRFSFRTTFSPSLLSYGGASSSRGVSSCTQGSRSYSARAGFWCFVLPFRWPSPGPKNARKLCVMTRYGETTPILRYSRPSPSPTYFPFPLPGFSRISLKILVCTLSPFYPFNLLFPSRHRGPRPGPALSSRMSLVSTHQFRSIARLIGVGRGVLFFFPEGSCNPSLASTF